MRKISLEQILERLKQENPWWKAPYSLPAAYKKWVPRPYLDLLVPLVGQTGIQRTVVLMGPRRVGKTVMIHHLIDRLFEAGIQSKNICYLSVDHPIYNGLSLEQFIRVYEKATSVDIERDSCYIFFDEIQYLKEWEKHLKSITDTYPNLRFLASGSAAAALKVKSTESGAGRFTDFLLPPLTFHEYLFLLNQTDLVRIKEKGKDINFEPEDISSLNSHFIDYLNFGGYPEVVFSDEVKSDPGRYIKSDIIDKVLLRDLPQLYGIHDIQELNYLFTSLAFNTAGEVSLEDLSQNSGVAKNTIKKYIEYFEAAFLVRIVHRIDRSAKRFKRANFFKVYLTNPSMRAALFSPVSSDDSAMGPLVETAIFSQWFHAEYLLFYARWKRGEVDIVSMSKNMKPWWAVEVKWSDRYFEHPEELKSLGQFCNVHDLPTGLITTRTILENRKIGNTIFEYCPASLYCYKLGYNIVKSKKTTMRFKDQ
jgi:predicted AAA+ superfamily ATPase